MSIGSVHYRSYRWAMPQDQQEKPVLPDPLPPADEVREIVKAYVDDQRAIIRKLRKMN